MMKTTQRYLKWGDRRYLKNKFIKGYCGRQHAWHNESFLLVPFVGDVTTFDDRANLAMALYGKYCSGSIRGSSYGATSYSLVRVFTTAPGKGVALVSECVGIGD